jgi:hypothetical protein
MATVFGAGELFNTTAGNKAVTVTPGISTLVVVTMAATGASAYGMSDNNAAGGGTYTLAAEYTVGGATNKLQVYVRDFLIGSATSTIFTATQTGSSGGGLRVYTVSPMFRAGAYAVRQKGGQTDGAAAATPAPVFELGAAKTQNACIGAVFNSTSPAGLIQPAGWSEGSDVGYSIPTTGLENVHRNSGETGTTITWGGTSATAFASVIIELDTSAHISPLIFHPIPLVQPQHYSPI